MVAAVPRRDAQLPLILSPPIHWGGRRAGAGRKPTAQRAGLPHATRAPLAARHPAHVTLKVRPDVPSLRSRRLVVAFERSMARACERGDFRLVHYSLQANHAHLMVEAESKDALARGMIAVGSRLARAVNRIFRRRGPVLADRYHVRTLKTPREVRNALRYVLLNASRHASRTLELDSASSARWFDGWRSDPPATPAPPGPEPRPIARARSWLLRLGWQLHGLLEPAAVPGPKQRRRGFPDTP